MLSRILVKLMASLLLVILSSAAAVAWDNSELSVSSWGVKTENWSKIRNSNVPVYGLLVKDKKTYRFARFSTIPDPAQAWVHLPSRNPTWNTYHRSCFYRLIGRRTCPKYADNQFMDRDLSVIGTTIGTLISAGIVPLMNGVEASFDFEPKPYQKAIDAALKNSNIDAVALDKLSNAWAVLKAREAEGNKLIDTANYNVSVKGTGNGALMGVSAKGLVEPVLQYPWVTKTGLEFDNFKDYHDAVITMAEKFGGSPLSEFAPLVSVCPGTRGERVVKEAVCTQTISRWENNRIVLSGSMDVLKWKLVPPRFLRLSNDDLSIDYDLGMITFTNISPKGIDLASLSFDFFGEKASGRLVGRRLNSLDAGRFVGFISNGGIRAIEESMPTILPDDLENEVQILVTAYYAFGFVYMRDFSAEHKMKGSELIKAELDQLQAVGKLLPVSMLDREYVAEAFNKPL